MAELLDDLIELFAPSFPPKTFGEKVALIDDIDRKYLNGRMTIDEILEVAIKL
jgi:hypothetical protein